LANTRPTPNRRRREMNADEEARIAVFAQQAETLQASVAPESSLAPALIGATAMVAAVKLPKVKSYTFRMTEETLERLRAAAAAEDRSIQWVFDKILLPSLEK